MLCHPVIQWIFDGKITDLKEDLKDLVIMHRESETRDFIQSGKKEEGIKRTILLAQRIVESSVNFIQP